jgi:hypothetical protein
MQLTRASCIRGKEKKKMAKHTTEFTAQQPTARNEERPETPEMQEFVEELRKRLPAYAAEVGAVPANEPGSVEWLLRVGRFWWEARERCKLTRADVARKMGVDSNRVTLFEVGLADVADAMNGFVDDFAAALGEPKLVSEFDRKFRQES